MITQENGAAETQSGAESIVSNYLNFIASYNSFQEVCDTDCDTFLRLGILGILLLKSHPSTHRNLTTSQNGIKGLAVVISGL